MNQSAIIRTRMVRLLTIRVLTMIVRVLMKNVCARTVDVWEKVEATPGVGGMGGGRRGHTPLYRSTLAIFAKSCIVKDDKRICL